MGSGYNFGLTKSDGTTASVRLLGEVILSTFLRDAGTIEGGLYAVINVGSTNE